MIGLGLQVRLVQPEARPVTVAKPWQRALELPHRLIHREISCHRHRQALRPPTHRFLLV
jgi:hypothetical protein